MGSAKSVVTYSSLRLITPYEISLISELRIVRRVNEHTLAYFTGIVAEDKKDTYIQKATPQDQIEIQLSEGTPKTLFKGVVSNIGIKFVRGVYYLEIEALSYTSEMDVALKKRSFQNKDMTYKAMIDNIIKDYSGDFKDFASKGAILKELAVQYEETDWDFLKRMASRLGAVLVPQSDVDKPKFILGISKEKDGNVSDVHNYKVNRDVSNFMDLSQNEVEGIDEFDFTFYEVESSNYMDLGWKVNFLEKDLVVVQSTAMMKKGKLVYKHILAPENGVKQNRIKNNNLIGLAIEGKIIEIQNDNVKVHLEIDKEQKKGEAKWFPYVASYTAEGNSGWYIMPQLNDSVKLYIQNDNEESSVVMSSVRKGGASHPKTAKPSVKNFETNFGKEMKLGEKEVVFTAKEGKMLITLDEGNGIIVDSNKPIAITADKDITLDAEKISFTAGESILVSRSSTTPGTGSAGEGGGEEATADGDTIGMDGETHLKSKFIFMDGINKTPMSLGDLIDMAVDTIMMPVETVQGLCAMGAMVVDASQNGKLGETAAAIVSNVPAVAGAKIVANDVMGTESKQSSPIQKGGGRLGVRGVTA